MRLNYDGESLAKRAAIYGKSLSEAFGEAGKIPFWENNMDAEVVKTPFWENNVDALLARRNSKYLAQYSVKFLQKWNE